ncbi:YbaK/EbsC family protein [Lysinibacillus sp. KU-BSD001]|uniref:YbaK/EbsC family protein n=1 Tax=Lysinibacillus sp. KU-BSD001 TaxID=3141328 RepID=UPI0036EF5D7D
MSLQAVQAFFANIGREGDIVVHAQSTASVQEAAEAIGVHPARIAKTLCFQGKDTPILVVAAGDTKVDNAKFKQTFAVKAKMLDPDSVLQVTGHSIGGVCPFGLVTDVPVYVDASLKRFTTVHPACGSSNSSIELTVDELKLYGHAQGEVDVCKDWHPALAQ